MYRHYRNNCPCNNSYKTENADSCGCDNNDYLANDCSYVQNYVTCYEPCDCGYDEGNMYFPENPMFGQSYVPFQTMNQTFTPRVGLKMGTIFPELVSPYMPGQSQELIEFIENSNTIGEGCNKC